MNGVTFAPRKNRIAQVHVLKKELGLSDEVYRGVLYHLTNKCSAADLTMEELNRVVSHLKTKRVKKPKHAHMLDPTEKKVWSLWQELADQGKVRDRSMQGLMGYIKTHIKRVDHIAWLDDQHLHTLIEQLKAWLER